jgi:hypothetical protein
MVTPKRLTIYIVCALAIVSISTSILLSRKFNYTFMDLQKVSRFTEERVAYQRVEHFEDPYKDNSVECLLIIKEKKMYLIKDGYDKLGDIKTQRLILDIENRLYDDEDMWVNKINGKPDFIKITERRVEIMTNFSEEFVAKNFGTFFITVRDAFIKRHVQIFRQLMRNRRESGLSVTRGPLPKPVYLGVSKEEREKTKFAITAVAKTIDEKVYYCEDADGDDVTETFTVTIPDGFDWGYGSGPNIILIYKNKSDAIKKLIGNLAHEAFYGTSEEDKTIIETFPKEQNILNMINDLVPDAKFYK